MKMIGQQQEAGEGNRCRSQPLMPPGSESCATTARRRFSAACAGLALGSANRHSVMADWW